MTLGVAGAILGLALGHGAAEALGRVVRGLGPLAGHRVRVGAAGDRAAGGRPRGRRGDLPHPRDPRLPSRPGLDAAETMTTTLAHRTCLSPRRRARCCRRGRRAAAPGREGPAECGRLHRHAATTRRPRARSRGSCSAGEDGAEGRQEVRPGIHARDPRARQAGREALRLHDAARPVGEAEALPARAVPAALLLLHARRARVDGRGDRRQAVRLHLRADHRRRAAWRCSTTTSSTTAHQRRPRSSPSAHGHRQPPAASPERAPAAHRALAGASGTEEYHSACACPPRRKPRCSTPPTTPRPRSLLLKAEIKDTAGATTSRRGSCSSTSTSSRAEPRGVRRALDAVHGEVRAVAARVDRRAATPAATRGATQSRERKDFFALKPGPDGELAGEIDKFARVRRGAGHGAPGRGQGRPRITRGRGDAARRRARCKLRKQQRADVVQQPRAAREACCAPPSTRRPPRTQRPYWLLLFELLILQGKNEEFEELGLEYAVAFEMSPPNWEVYVNSVAAAVAKAAPGRRQGRRGRAAPDAGFELKGVLSSASANQIAELNGHAAEPRRGGGRHGQGAAHRVRLHLGVLRRGQGDPARRQARDPHRT